MDAITGARITGLVDEIHSQKKRLDKLERSTDLTHSAIDTGGIVVKDAEGNERIHIGQTDAGVVTTSYRNGPVPNQASTPTVESGVGSINVTWDGMDVAGNPSPEDFKSLNVYASLDPEFETDPGNFVGVISSSDGGTKTIALHYGSWYVRTAILTESRQIGPASDSVGVQVLSVVELPDVAEEFAQGREDMQALDGKIAQAQTDLQAASERIDAAEDVLSPLPGDLASIRTQAETAVEAAQKARDEALAAQTAATEANARATSSLPNGSFEEDLAYWEATGTRALPTITTNAYVAQKAARFTNNTGIRSTVAIPVVPGQIWELSTYYRSDTKVATSGGIYAEFHDAQKTLPVQITSKPTPDVSGTWVRAYLRATIPANMDHLIAKIDYTVGGVTIDEFTVRDVTDVVRLEQAAQDAAAKSQEAINKANVLEGKLANLQVGHDALKDRLTKAESDLATGGQQATADLAALDAALRDAFAEADAESLVSAGELAEKAKADAVAVAQADATAKADKALANAATAALATAKTEAQREAAEAQTAAEAHANGLPKVLHGTAGPTASAPEASVYFQHEGSITGRVIGQWVRSGGAWTSTPITSAAIANLDVGKLTAGSAIIDTAVLNKVWADLGVFNRLTAGEAWIGGAQIKNGAITAEKITVTDTLVANILGAQSVVANVLIANGNLWAKAAQIITLDASRLTVTDTATINEAVIEKFWAQTAVIQRLTAGEAWIGETVIKNGAITAPKIRADAVEASHIKAKAIKADHMDFVSTDPTSGGSMVMDSSGIRLQREGSTIFQLTNNSVDTVSLIGGDGSTVAGMSNDGTVTGQVGAFDEITLGGASLTSQFDEAPRGLVARAVRTSITGINPSTSATHLQPVMRMEFDTRAGYTYEIRAEGLGVYMNNYTGTTARFLMYTQGDGKLAELGVNLRVQVVTPIRSSDNGDTAPVSMVYHFSPSTDYVASVLIGYSINKGTEPVRINCASTRPFVLTAREFEKVTTTGKVDFLGTAASEDSSTENVVAERRVTQTWTASASQSWRNNVAYNSPNYPGKHLWQGIYSGDPSGVKKSHAVFGAAGDKGQTIATAAAKMTKLEKLEVYLYNGLFQSYTGGKARLKFHNSTSTTAYPAVTLIGDVSFAKGEGKWVTITNTTARDAFLAGNLKGIALDADGSSSTTYYGYFKGADGGSLAPKIRATYMTT